MLPDLQVEVKKQDSIEGVADGQEWSTWFVT